MGRSVRFDQAEMKSGAFGRPEAGLPSLPRSGKRQLSLEGLSRRTRKAVPREAPNTTKWPHAAVLRWSVSVAVPVAGSAASAVASAAQDLNAKLTQGCPGQTQTR
jgi:hypothetical protein